MRSSASVDHRLDSTPVEVADRVHGDVELAHERLLARVERADADECDALGIDRRQRQPVSANALAADPEHRRERHPVDVSARRRLGRVEVAVRVQPEDAAGAGSGQPAQCADRDRVVAAEDERHQARTSSRLDLARDPDAGLEDRVEVPCLVGAAVACLREARRRRSRDPRPRCRRARVGRSARHSGSPRTHVDASATRAEIERGSDDRHPRRHAHTLERLVGEAA